MSDKRATRRPGGRSEAHLANRPAPVRSPPLPGAVRYGLPALLAALVFVCFLPVFANNLVFVARALQRQQRDGTPSGTTTGQSNQAAA